MSACSICDVYDAGILELMDDGLLDVGILDGHLRLGNGCQDYYL